MVGVGGLNVDLAEVSRRVVVEKKMIAIVNVVGQERSCGWGVDEMAD